MRTSWTDNIDKDDLGRVVIKSGADSDKLFVLDYTCMISPVLWVLLARPGGGVTRPDLGPADW